MNVNVNHGDQGSSTGTRTGVEVLQCEVNQFHPSSPLSTRSVALHQHQRALAFPGRPPRRLAMASEPRTKCVFCQICGENAAGTELIVSTDELVAIRDIRPVAKHHFLVVTREHIRDPKALKTEHKPLLQRMVSVAEQVLRDHGADMTDYRLGFHWPPFCFYKHLHLHVFSPTTNMALINRIFFKENTCWFVPPEFVMSRLK